MNTKVLIIGSGCAGYTAGIYASRAGLNPILVAGVQEGGQITTTTDVENFPGYRDGVSGFDMISDFEHQARKFGTTIEHGVVTNVNFNTHPFIITLESKKTYLAESVIIATGASPKKLGIEDETKFLNKGVSYCATCDGFFYRNKTVAVVGGGDTACEEAIYLSNITQKVYMIVRSKLRASQIMQERVLNNPKIEILFECEVIGLNGDDKLSSMVVLDNYGLFEYDIDGLFIAIGHHPNSDIFSEFIDIDEHGYIKTNGNTTHTNINGVFACGDVQDPFYKQAITAAGSGCKAAIDAERWLKTL